MALCLVIGAWELDIICNLGFVDWNLMQAQRRLRDEENDQFYPKR